MKAKPESGNLKPEFRNLSGFRFQVSSLSLSLALILSVCAARGANRYWIDATGLASWDDNVAGVTPWATTSGGNDNAATPVSGDSVYFDANSPTAPVAGPAAPVTLARLDMTGSTLTLPTLEFVTIQASGVAIFTGATSFTGQFASSGTVDFYNTSQSNLPFTAGLTVTFHDTSTNNATTATATTTIVFAGTSTNAGALDHGLVTFSGTVANNAAITVESCTITGTVNGSGNITGPVTVDGGNCAIVIIGNVSIINAGVQNATVSGNITASGANSIMLGTTNGTVTLSSGAKNTGHCTTLVAAYSTGANTWGAWDVLSLTGLPSGSSGPKHVGKGALIE